MIVTYIIHSAPVEVKGPRAKVATPLANLFPAKRTELRAQAIAPTLPLMSVQCSAFGALRRRLAPRHPRLYRKPIGSHPTAPLFTRPRPDRRAQWQLPPPRRYKHSVTDSPDHSVCVPCVRVYLMHGCWAAAAARRILRLSVCDHCESSLRTNNDQRIAL